MNKCTGILCPLSCLPNKYGIGDLGIKTYEFVDIISAAGIKVWQVLPLNPLGEGNSPYAPTSSHAGDEIYINLDMLVEDGLLKPEEVTYFNADAKFVDYKKVREVKTKLYQVAFSRFEETDDYKKFIEENAWVNDYALFKVFLEHEENKEWTEWDDEYKYYNKKHNYSLIPFTKEINYQLFLQYIFFKQWHALKKYINDHDIIVLGDMPFYVGLNSVECWMNQESFLLDEEGYPTSVAGVPPDYFSKYGQRWGNPIYNWDYMKAHHFDFWIKRLRGASELYDALRVDHFRAFDTYWSIPAEEPTAILGEWKEAPGYALFDTIKKEIPELTMLAEDLGDLRQEVLDLRDHYDLKGMFVFMFHGHEEYKYDFNKVVVYSGTHDNETLVGWINNLDEWSKEDLKNRVKDCEGDHLNQQCMNYILSYDAETVIFPLWDILELDNSSRFNTPGTMGSPNWEFRIKDFNSLSKKLIDLRVQLLKNKRI